MSNSQSPAASSSRNTGSAKLLLVSLSRFYAQRTHMQAVLPYITCKSGVSLRLIDWFVTNYSKKHNIVLPRRQCASTAPFNVYLSYRAQLKAYSKQQFDPFRRRDRIVFYYEREQCVETTLGQLNFFRWLLQNDVLGYIVENAAVIEDDMLCSSGAASRGQLVAHNGGSKDVPELPTHEHGPCVKSVDDRGGPHKPNPALDQHQNGPELQQDEDHLRRKRVEPTSCRAASNLTCMVGKRVVVFE